MAMDDTLSFWQQKIYNKSLREKRRFQHIRRYLGSSTANMNCLVAGGTPALHLQVHRISGNWTSAALDAHDQALLQATIGSADRIDSAKKFPYEDHSFDRIILCGILDSIADDSRFMAECHRILKDSGILLINVHHRKRIGLLPLFRKFLDISDFAGPHRNGYSSSELFDLLKDGFDVEETHTYSRFFIESTNLLINFIGGFLVQQDPSTQTDAYRGSGYQRIYTFRALVYPLECLLSLLDYISFLTRGYLLIARAKRRTWRPRKTPVLRDGRSIAEATLSGKIGTALEY